VSLVRLQGYPALRDRPQLHLELRNLSRRSQCARFGSAPRCRARPHPKSLSAERRKAALRTLRRDDDGGCGIGEPTYELLRRRRSVNRPPLRLYAPDGEAGSLTRFSQPYRARSFPASAPGRSCARASGTRAYRRVTLFDALSAFFEEHRTAAILMGHPSATLVLTYALGPRVKGRRLNSQKWAPAFG